MTAGRPRFARRRGDRKLRNEMVSLPNGFTLFNLFCGIHAIVLASRGEFSSAVLWIVLGGVADALDGRVARATGTGTRLGEELDSLVDAISFGVAPAMLVYFSVLRPTNWEWLLVFLFAACAVMRLARFNVEQAGSAKTHFHGLPSPAAGMTLASYWWFSQTPLYNQAVILFTDSTTLAQLPWQWLMKVLMVMLGFLMLSDVPYPAVPTIGWRTMRQRIGSLIVFGSLAGLVLIPKHFIFPALISYVIWGLGKWVILGFLGRRRSSPDPIFWEEEPTGRTPDPVPLPYDLSDGLHPDLQDPDDDYDTGGDDDADDASPAQPSTAPRPPRRKRRRRRPRGPGSGPGGAPSSPSPRPDQ
jgi:CDP-diacylglycerol---serine O-phosphatidyltransferase